jgi:hypothetical protein
MEKNTYHCITLLCDGFNIKYRPVPWELERVDE